MDYNFLFRHFTWLSLIYLNVYIRTCLCHYRRPYISDSYSYGRPGRTSRNSEYESEYNYYDSDDDYGPPQRPSYRRPDYSQYDRTEYGRGYPYPDTGITSFGSTDVNTRRMMKVSDLNDLPKTHGKGGKKVDPKAEEQIDGSPVMARAPVSRRDKKDGLGKIISSPKCGKTSDTNLNRRVVGGKDAEIGAHPWIVAILKDGEAWCGGSIINKRWILTAAHCFMGDEPEQSIWAIRVGTVDRNSGRTYKVKKVITHERFNLDNMLNSDLALMMTTKDIDYDPDTIQPVCLPDNSYDEPRAPNVTIAGWGATKFDDENMPIYLQDVTLNVVKDGECAKKYRQKKYTLYKSQFCTWNYKKDACQGDSGGPAVELVKGKVTLVGVVSYGSTCADDFPGVYTQISYFLNWISNTMNVNEEK